VGLNDPWKKEPPSTGGMYWALDHRGGCGLEPVITEVFGWHDGTLRCFVFGAVDSPQELSLFPYWGPRIDPPAVLAETAGDTWG